MNRSLLGRENVQRMKKLSKYIDKKARRIDPGRRHSWECGQLSARRSERTVAREGGVKEGKSPEGRQ